MTMMTVLKTTTSTTTIPVNNSNNNNNANFIRNTKWIINRTKIKIWN